MELFYGFLIVVLFGIAVVVILGITPPKIPTTPAGLKQMQSRYVTMEDGTRIAIRLNLPLDLETGERIPTITETTRYLTEIKNTFLLNIALKLSGDKKANLGIGHAFLASGYAFIQIDARGSGASFGSREIEWSPKEIQDIGEVIDWVVEQPWSDGQVASYGVSYSGNTAELAAVLNHPHLVAAAPFYSDFDPLAHNAMPGGIANTYLIENWHEGNALMDANQVKGIFVGGINPVDEDVDEQLLAQALQERDNLDLVQAFETVTFFDDPLTEQYAAQSLAPFWRTEEIERSGVPFLVRVGWLDVGTVDGAIERFLSYSNPQMVFIGPWSHAERKFVEPFMTTEVSRKELDLVYAEELLAFFDRIMKDKQEPVESEIHYYTMGEGVWKTTTVWPVEGMEPRRYYLGSGGLLDQALPGSLVDTVRYEVDFTTTTGEQNRWRTNLGGGDVVYPDRAAEDTKLLTFTSDPLETDIEITGNPVVTLNILPEATDGAFYVYLEAVSPDGVVTYITEGQLGALHRAESSQDLGRIVVGPKHSYTRQDGKEMTPGENTQLEIGMFATSVLIQEGWHLRIALAGHDASNFARIPAEGAVGFEVQVNSSLPSFVELPVRER